MGWSWSLYFHQQVLVHVGGLARLQEITALHDRRAALPLVLCATQHALYVDNFACIALDANQVQQQTDKIAGTAQAAGLTKANSKDEFLGISFDGVVGHVSVESRRIWMIKLSIEQALRRNALSGASLRRLVGH